MSNSRANVKVYRNSDRSKPEVRKKYVPQYQVRGIEPEEFVSSVVPSNTVIAKSTPLPPTNPRARRPTIRQPYAKVIPSPVGRGRGPVPNVGNNMEHTWSSVDGDIVDDLPEHIIDNQHKMIDNNEFVSDEVLEFEPSEEEYTESKFFMTEKDLQEVIKESDLSNFVEENEIKNDEYIILISGTVFNIGPLDFIQEEVKALVFGEHVVCEGTPIPVEDLLVLKKVKINIGVFLE